MTNCRILAAAAVVLLCACSGTAPPAPAPQVTWEQVDRADGETLYVNLCASCHGLDGRGDGPVADQLTIEVPDLTTLARRNGGEFPLARVEDTIYGPGIPAVHGDAGMPVWGPALKGVFDTLPYVDREAFAANRIRRIVRHLESLQVDGG